MVQFWLLLEYCSMGKPSIAVIGAGVTGLTVGHFLKDFAAVTLFERSYRAGGRVSTQYTSSHSFDHGAQFFTAKTPAFKAFISPLIFQGVVKSWEADFVEIRHQKIFKKRRWGLEYPHYVGCPDMSSLGRYLSKDLNIIFDKNIVSTQSLNNNWLLTDQSGPIDNHYDWLVLTIPPEQAAQIVSNEIRIINEINNYHMKSCFSLMLSLKSDVKIPFQSALVHDQDISWISLNSSKPERGKLLSLVVHSTNQWADEHLQDQEDQVISYLFGQLNQILNIDTDSVIEKKLHRWRYANIAKSNQRAFLLDEKNKIAICGDWLIQGRVEAAFTSGLKLSQSLSGVLSSS